MEALSASLTAELQRFKTKSDKIRALDSKGMPRADIARALGIRYQHVRNVLEQDKLKARATSASQPPPAPDSDPGSAGPLALDVEEDGTVRLPEAFRRAMALQASGRVTATVVDGELRLISPLAAIRRAQRELAPLRKPGESVVDEFLAERRSAWSEE